MKTIMICGSHPRHLYVAKKMRDAGLLDGIIMMQREQMIDETPPRLEGHIRDLYEYHFSLRAKMEDNYFGDININEVLESVPHIEIERSMLNNKGVEDFIKDTSADCLLSYGSDIIRENILSLVNGRAFNLHGGLSHWYKGSATMFWPFYFLEPNYVGTTLHYITMKIDGGNIIQHTVPELEKGDCMHEVACKSIVAASEDICKVFERMAAGESFDGVPQKKNGKLFLEKDWRPEHLKLIYDTYGDKIVDYYLDGRINVGNSPKLIKAV